MTDLELEIDRALETDLESAIDLALEIDRALETDLESAIDRELATDPESAIDLELEIDLVGLAVQIEEISTLVISTWVAVTKSLTTASRGQTLIETKSITSTIAGGTKSEASITGIIVTRAGLVTGTTGAMASGTTATIISTIALRQTGGATIIMVCAGGTTVIG